MLFGNKHFTQVGDATLFFYLFTSRILTFAGERSDRTNVKIRLVNGQSPVKSIFNIIKKLSRYCIRLLVKTKYDELF